MTGAKRYDSVSDETRAAKKIGFMGSPWSLFYANNWPDDLGIAYYAARTPLQRAKIGAKRIDHLIKTGE